MDTLNYADESLRPAIKTGLAWAVLISAAVILLLAPFLSVTLHAWVFTEYHYEFSEWRVHEHMWKVTVLGILWWVILNLRVLFVNGPRWWRRNWKKYLLPFALSLVLIPLCMISFEHRGFLVNWVKGKREVERLKAEHIAKAIFSYLETHNISTPVVYDRYAKFPPHLSTLVSGGRLAAADLVFSGEGAKVPGGLVEADWPRISGLIDANCDWVYVGADLVNDETLGQVRGGAYDVIIAYSREPFFHDGYLVISVGMGARFVKEKEFAGIFAAHNARREEFFLPPQTIGVATPPPAPSPAIPPADLAREKTRRDYFYSAPFPERDHHDLEHAIVNYAVEHEGYYPPHAAALIAGKYIAGGNLIDPTSTRTPYTGDVSGMTEADWPKIEADVELHSDFVLACADMRLPAKWEFDRDWIGIITAYSKAVHPEELRVLFNSEHQFAQFGYSYVWRQAWVTSNWWRLEKGLPRIVPDTPHPNPYGKTTPGMVPAGPDHDLEVARRNAAVIATQIREEYLRRPSMMRRTGSLLELIWDGRISPRHLKCPLSSTPLLELGDSRIPPRNSIMERFERSQWDAKYSDYSLWHTSAEPGTNPDVVTLKSDFGRRVSVVGYWDGTAVIRKW